MSGGWNYRVFCRQHPSFCGAEPEVEYYIGEAYYDDGDEVTSWSDAIYPRGDDLGGLRQDILHMLEACDKPVIVEDA